MKMNAAEKLVVNSSLRRAVQRHYETPLLRRLGADVAGAHVLEIGAGSGGGTQVLLDVLHARHVVAIDLDPAQVALARRRLGTRQGEVQLACGDAARLAAAANSFDAVVDFGILHHVPDWRQAVAEIARVLRPGGQFVFEEVTAQALDRASYRVLFDHPRHDRFTGPQFIAELERHGLTVGGRFTQRFFGDFVLGVAERHS